MAFPLDEIRFAADYQDIATSDATEGLLLCRSHDTIVSQIVTAGINDGMWYQYIMYYHDICGYRVNSRNNVQGHRLERIGTSLYLP